MQYMTIEKNHYQSRVQSLLTCMNNQSNVKLLYFTTCGFRSHLDWKQILCHRRFAMFKVKDLCYSSDANSIGQWLLID